MNKRRSGAAARPQSSRPVLTTVMALAIFCSASGCSLFSPPTPIPARAALIGTWVHNGPKNIRSTLTLHQNGIIDLVDTPENVFLGGLATDMGSPERPQWKTLKSMTGSWQLTSERFGNDPSINVTLKEVEGPGGLITTIEVSGTGKYMTLYTFIGDLENDNSFSYHRLSQAK